ncbi:hypothetical protein RAZWK3B_16630 [Roseobacter sp. AzwK-3b]|uniref:PLxRFG domain-containing protein n=1 Tax=Roseobacter sp. AzwK-3b TaxID=351016 RepID=UPI000156C072|nr:PLxRFG domain-containing protein [Roseobacter sp. AzwK-3b]EDM71041.1 hypothetical protein RAZWK3B_16630 [Roseobacter sp. AzwK-3b]
MNDMPVFAPEQEDLKTQLEDIAISTGTPIEVLVAAADQAQARDANAMLDVARKSGEQLGPRFKAGEDPTAILAEAFGEDTARGFKDYATNIRADLYGTPTAQEQYEAELENEGFGDKLKRRGQQFVRGATEPFASMPEAAAIAESQIDDSDAPAEDLEGFQRGQNIRDRVQDVVGTPNPADDSFGGQFAEGFGNLVGMGGAALAAGVAGTAVGGPVVGTVAGIGTGATIGASMNSSQLYREALQMGADEETAIKSSRWGVAIGASDILPLARAFKFLPQSVRQRVGNGVMKRFVDIAQSAGEEAAQEYLATVANNIVAQQLYDPERGWTENATESAIVGAALGGTAGAIGAGYDAYRNRAPRDNADPNAPSDGPLPASEGAEGMVPPVAGPDPAGSEPPEEPTPLSDAVSPGDDTTRTGPTTGGLSDAASRAPLPVLGDMAEGQPVLIETVDPETGELSGSIEAVYSGEDIGQGFATFEAPDGTPLEVDIAEIKSGNVLVSPRAVTEASAGAQAEQAAEPAPAPQTRDSAQQPQTAAPSLPPIPGGVDPDAFMERVAIIAESEGVTNDEAYQIALRDTLAGMERDVSGINMRDMARENEDLAAQSRIEDAVFTDERGQPVIFPDEATAQNQLGQGFAFEPFGDGVIAIRQPQEDVADVYNGRVPSDGFPVPDRGDIAPGSLADGAVPGQPGDNAGGGSGDAQPTVQQGVSGAEGGADVDAPIAGPEAKPFPKNTAGFWQGGTWADAIANAVRGQAAGGMDTTIRMGANGRLRLHQFEGDKSDKRNIPNDLQDYVRAELEAAGLQPLPVDEDAARAAMGQQSQAVEGGDPDGVLQGQGQGQGGQEEVTPAPGDAGARDSAPAEPAVETSPPTPVDDTAPTPSPVDDNAAPEPAANDAPPSTLDGKLRAARDAGTVEHVTQKGKKLTGVVLKDVTRDEAKSIDQYSFRKDGGYFIREKDVTTFLDSEGAGDDPSRTGNLPERINQIITPDNMDGTGSYAIDGADVLIDDLGDGDAEITLTERSYRYVGRTRRVGEKSQRLRYSAIKDDLSPEARAAVEAIIQPPAPNAPPVEDAPTNATAAPAEVDYPNRKLNMRKARVDEPVNGIGDNSDMSLGNIALANAREGDVLPGVGTVLKVTEKQIQISKPDGNVVRMSQGNGEKINSLARDMGALIASSANLRDEQLGSLVDMIERDPALVYRDGVPMLFDDPAEQANRGQRARASILRPLGGGSSPNNGFASMAEVARYIEDNAPAGYMLEISGENSPAVLRDPDLNPVHTYPGIPQRADVDRHLAKLRSKIEDFGEKIGGARKDLAKSYKESMSQYESGSDLIDSGASLPELIPEPDYAKLAEAGVSPQALGIISFLRGSIRRKPTDRFRQYDWAGEVRAAQETIAQLIDGELAPFDWAQRGNDSLYRKADRFHAQTISLMDYDLMGMAGRMNFQMFSAGDVTARANWPGPRVTHAYAKTPEEMATKIKDLVQMYRKKRESQKEQGYDFDFHIRYNRAGQAFIYARKPKVTKIKTFNSVAEARAALNDENQLAEIQAEAEKMKNGPREWREISKDRQGPERRKGDVTPKQFEKAFGFRGVEFGNYTTQKERQEFLNKTYDAFMDLAGALGVPAETLSLNGKLGIAFGARGQGNRGGMTAAAHYEPGKTVINMTKNAGAGSLAHEWWHAVDNHIARKNAGNDASQTLYTENQAQRAYVTGELDEDFHKSIYSLIRSIKSTGWHKRLVKFDEMRAKPYWSSNVEETARLFEAMVVERLDDRDMVNDYLSSMDGNSGAYPSLKDMGELRSAFNNVIGFIERDFTKGGGTVPVMPDLRPDARTRPPEVGREWQSADGARKIVDRGTRERAGEPQDYFVVQMEGIEETVKVPVSEIGRIIARDEYSLTEEGQRERAEKKAEEEAARAADDARKSVKQAKAERREAFMDSQKADTSERRRIERALTKELSFGTTRQDRIDELVTDGRAVIKDVPVEQGGIGWVLTSPSRGAVTGSDLAGFGRRYAEWAIRQRDRQQEADNEESLLSGTGEAALESQSEAPQENDADAGAILDSAFDAVFGTEEGDQAADDGAQDTGQTVEGPATRLQQVADLIQGSDGAQDTGARSYVLAALKDLQQGRSPDAVIPNLQEASQRLFRQFPDTSDVLDEIVSNLEGQTPQPGTQRSAGEAASSAARNTVDGMKNLGQAMNELFGGSDPSKLNMGLNFSRETYEKAKPLFIEAVRRFGQAGQDLRDLAIAMVRGLQSEGMNREAQQNMRPYLERFIEDVRSGEIAPFEEAESTTEGGQQATEDTGPTEAPEGAPQRVQVGAEFANAFREGREFKTIVQARAFAEEVAGEKMSNKDVEEAIEAGLVMRAREVAAQSANPSEAYGQLVDLYKTQPNLATRTSESVEQQAYSTPAPLAYIASQLADVRSDTSVYEPSAGNGMLLIEADPELVTANELNDARFSVLDALYDGASLTQRDGASFAPDGPFDRIIANPPFGKVKDANLKNKRWAMDGFNTTEIDHAIAWKALSQMKDGGRAVLIIGGMKADTDAERAKGYKARGRHPFYTKLYDQYNVTEHFTVAGDLYKRQGAAWPVDVIVIEGRGQSAKPYPYVTAPALYSDWGDFGRRLTNDGGSLDPRQQQNGDRNDSSQTEAGNGADAPTLPGGVGQQDQSDGAAGATGGSERSRAASSNQRGAGSDGDQQSGRFDGGNERAASQSERDGRSEMAGSGEQAGSQRARSQQTDEQRYRPDGSDGDALRGVNRPENTETETDYQVRYQPHSDSRFAVGTLVPRNMQTAIDKALEKIKQRVGGNIDQYVADKLGYTLEEVTGTENAPGYFSAEQVDALAMAIDNVEQGAGFIVGDQTGVGKGRFVAAMLRYATLNGMVPVFVTKQPGLFADMIRDLRDIGETTAEKSILTSQSLRGQKAVPLSEASGDVLPTPSEAKLKSALAEMQKTGRLPEGYDMFFTTYSQLQYKAGSSGGLTPRQKALNAIAPNAMMVLDESHEAGGTETRQIDKNTGEPKPTRADYVREVLQRSRGAVYSSATYAKNPTVMSLYNRTDLQYAVESMDELADTVKAGGVPLQQIMANMLVESGQYARRERSFEGVSMEEEVLPTDVAMAETSSKLMSGVFNLDRDYMEDLREAFLGQLEERGLLAGMDRAVGEEAVGNSVGFANVMHNVVNQALFALKADAVADRAIELHKRGEKPLIAVTNTNEALLRDYIADAGLAEGDAVDMQFNVIFERYLNRLRRVTVKDSNDNKQHFWMTDSDITELGGPEALNAVKAIEKQIKDADLSGMPAMPLDYVYDRLTQAGLKVEEITGRSITARGGKITSREASDAAKKRAMNGFNSGRIDAVILNKSGSTGFSLHATGKEGNDGNKRHMLILQPDPNIDTFMQMLGRIHRTGQTKLPSYTIAVSDLALEKRVSANLMKKMASLNANTTASKSSAVSLDSVVDFLNKYGDVVVNEILRDDAELASRINVYPRQRGGIAGLAGKVTGRLSLLPPSEVEEIYDRVSQAYIEYVEALDKMGMNTLEAKTLDLRAVSNSKEVLQESSGDGSSPFMQEAFVEDVSVRKLGQPYTMDELKAEIVKVTENNPEAHVRQHGEKLDALLPGYIKKLESSLKKAQERLASAKTDSQKTRESEAVANWQSKINGAQQTVREVKDMIEELRPGKFKAVTLVDEDSGQQRSYEAVPVEINTKGLKDNPTALSQIKVRFALADASREVWVPFSKLMDENAPFSYRASSAERVQFQFENGMTESRENRQIITGNVVSGFSKLGKRGQIIMFTRDDGSVEHGVMLPRDFNVADELEKKPVTFTKPEHVAAFLDEEPERRIVQDDSGVVTITNRGGERYTIKVQNRGGKPFYLNPAVRNLVGDFEGRGKGMRAMFRGRDTLKQVIEAYQTQLGTKFITETSKEEARAITGEKAYGNLQAAVAKRRPADFEAAAADVVQSTPEDRKRLTKLRKDMRAELRKIGISASISLDIRDELIAFPGMPPLDGYFLDGVIGVSASAPEGPMAIMRHEVIHALRNKELWGKDYGLFTQKEWRTVSRAARADAGIMRIVERDYPRLSRERKTEEAVAIMFQQWNNGAEGYQGALARALKRLSRIIEAISNALRGNGLNTAAGVFEGIRDGRIGARQTGASMAAEGGTLQASVRREGMDPDPTDMSLRERLSNMWQGGVARNDNSMDQKERRMISNLLTDAMGSSDKYNILSLAPGEVLFRELGRELPSAKKWVDTIRKMNIERNERHYEADKLAREWQGAYAKDKKNGRAMFNLMYEATLARVDPSERFKAPKRTPEMRDVDYGRVVEQARAEYGQMRARFQALPEQMQDLFRRVRDSYKKFDDDLIDAMVDNVSKSMDLQAARLKTQFEQDLQDIRDEGLAGDARAQAEKTARNRYNTAIGKLKFSRQARVRQMRLKFERNRIDDPYFPLLRFGQYFATVRDEEGKVVSFSRFQTVGKQNQFIKRMEGEGYRVESGVMDTETNMNRYVDPNFVADVQELLGDAAGDGKLADAIWQRWLETLPDFSVRTANIHRKGTPGFDRDAIRAYGTRMFHGAHQLARLKYGADMTKFVEATRKEAKLARDPNRAGMVANEMMKRHQWAMNPQSSTWSAWATGAAFVWYLGITPSAAIVNLTQTTTVGIPVLTAGIEGATVKSTSAALGKALKDFTGGVMRKGLEPGTTRGVRTSANLTAEEQSAMVEAYRRGVIDKSQAHDITAIKDGGVEYSPVREKVMRPIAFFFHHAERLNREVTYLAAYRLLRKQGVDIEQAIDRAANLTWDAHFNYENWARPRFMQDDFARVALTFRNFTINMLYRLFRDTHQALQGESPEVRKQARAHLIGITSMMLLQAGITGTWGYALMMLLAGMFFDGGSDEAEEELKGAVVGLFGPGAGGMLLNGVPGQLTGVDLSSRIGMPELWFRKPNRNLEGKEAYQYWVEQLIGPVPGIAAGFFRGMGAISDGEVWRGFEYAVPKAIRDQMRFVRYLNEGVTTYKGEPLLDGVSAHDAIVQSLGFSPARVSERYEQNRRMMNMQAGIQDDRRKILADVTAKLRKGEPVSEKDQRRIQKFNEKYPTYPITYKTIERSLNARMRISDQMQGGVRLNPKLDGYIRDAMAPSINN